MTVSGQTATGEQFYVTHCVTADSVMNTPGYSVRAASDATDAAALRLALEYPPYELPLDLWRDKPSKAMAPRRLARTRHPRDGIWVVHSVYLEKDTMNRDRSYFSHLMQLSASTDAASILRSWDAPEWVKEYPLKADKTLPRGRLPVGTAIGDESLMEFLSGPANGPAELAAAVCPVRLRSDVALRTDLVLRFLHGILLATREDTERDRFFVHAEPGLVAMLLYAATRLLPPIWMTDLTFSTFEPAHRGLRDYTLAEVIGTYTGSTGKGLDPDLVTSRGYGLDTLRAERSSRELGAAPHGLLELIEIAARGEWDLLADVHRLIGAEPDALGRIGRTVPLARALARLKAGKPTIEDLITLKGDAKGATVLAQQREKVWPHVRTAALSDAGVRGAFKEWCAEPAQLTEFRRDAAAAMLKGDLTGWDSRWTVVREVAERPVARDQLEQAIKGLDDHLPAFPPASRIRLREACAEVGLFPDHHLLAPNGPDELAALLSAQTPPDWQGYACFVVMGPDEKNWLLPATAPHRPAMRDRVRRHLLSATPAVLGGYLKHARPFITTDPVFLYQLLQPFSKTSPLFLDRLIEGGAAVVDATDWLKLLADLDVYNAPEWQGFLFQNDHLAKLLAGFRADPAATKIWGDYLDLLSADLFEEDEWELTLYDQLRKAREALGRVGVTLRSVLPNGGAAKLNAIDAVLGVIAHPQSAENLPSGELLRAFQTFWPQDPVQGLRLVYLKGKYNTLDLPRELARLDSFLTVFLACCPITHEYFSVRTAVAYWVDLSTSCPLDNRATFQLHLLYKCVIRDWYRAILEENRRIPFLPEAEARIREAIMTPMSNSGERYTRPTGGTVAGDGDVFSSPVTQKARKAKGQGRGAARRGRSRGLSGGAWALIVVGVISLIVLGVAVAMKIGGGGTPTEPDHPSEHKQPTAPNKPDAKKQNKNKEGSGG